MMQGHVCLTVVCTLRLHALNGVKSPLSRPVVDCCFFLSFPPYASHRALILKIIEMHITTLLRHATKAHTDGYSAFYCLQVALFSRSIDQFRKSTLPNTLIWRPSKCVFRKIRRPITILYGIGDRDSSLGRVSQVSLLD